VSRAWGPEASSQVEGPAMVVFSPFQFDVLPRRRQNELHTAIAHANDRAKLLAILGLATPAP
jgi:hypothetical protein